MRRGSPPPPPPEGRAPPAALPDPLFLRWNTRESIYELLPEDRAFWHMKIHTITREADLNFSAFRSWILLMKSLKSPSEEKPSVELGEMYTVSQVSTARDGGLKSYVYPFYLRVKDVYKLDLGSREVENMFTRQYRVYKELVEFSSNLYARHLSPSWTVERFFRTFFMALSRDKIESLLTSPSLRYWGMSRETYANYTNPPIALLRISTKDDVHGMPKAYAAITVLTNRKGGDRFTHFILSHASGARSMYDESTRKSPVERQIVSILRKDMNISNPTLLYLGIEIEEFTGRARDLDVYYKETYEEARPMLTFRRSWYNRLRLLPMERIRWYRKYARAKDLRKVGAKLESEYIGEAVDEHPGVVLLF